MNPFARPCLIASAALFLAVGTPAGASSTTKFNVTIDASKVHESCIKMRKDETARYEWKSDVPLDFNIHYHEGQEVFYPVKRNGATGGKDSFKAKIAQDYCWMWTATKPARLEGKVEK